MSDSQLKTQKFTAGHVLFKQGDIAQSCFLVRDGVIALSRADTKGNDKRFATITKGEIIGEMSMIGGTPRTATATVTKDCELAEISREEFECQIERLNPFMRRLIKLIVQRLRDTTVDLVRGDS